MDTGVLGSAEHLVEEPPLDEDELHAAEDVFLSDELWAAEGPFTDALDLVVETAVVSAVFAAQRYDRVDAFRLQERRAAQARGETDLALVDRAVRLELAAALRITENAAGRLMATAEALVHRYPRALDALAHAALTEQHAQILVDALDSVEPATRDRVADDAVRLAQEYAVGPFRRALRRLLDAARADTLAERCAQALERRHVELEVGDDGMAWLTAHLPAVEATAVFERLTAMAKSLAIADDDRTLDQRRADVLCDLLIDGESASLPDALRGIRPAVAVTVPLLSLLGRTEAGPAVVEGVGPIPLERARELCGSATEGWIRVLTHPETGTVLSVGRERYRPPPDLQRFIRLRASRCLAPGCGMPSSRCEIDHTVAWADGGETSADNPGPMCTGHHTVKHHTGWRVRPVDGVSGAVEWTSPAGRSYVVRPEPRGPAFAPVPASTRGSSPPLPDDAPF